MPAKSKKPPVNKPVFKKQIMEEKEVHVKEIPSEPMETPVHKERVVTVSHFGKKQILYLLLAILLLAAAAAPTYYYYSEYQKAQMMLKNPTKAAQIETEEIVKKVNKLILLPGGEAPTMATVSDVSKLQTQDFFKNAKNGDKVLIYSKAKKAYLYRPSENVLVEVSPLEVTDNKQAQTPTVPTGQPVQASKSPLKVAIYNGTGTSGLGGKIEEELKSKIDALDVTGLENAGKRDYAKTIVIDITGKSKEGVTQISKALGASITNLPNTEKNPKGADILVIVGADKNTKPTVQPSPTEAEAEESPTPSPEE